MVEVASRTRALPAPRHVVWESLTDPGRPGSRPWLALQPDEVAPELAESDEGTRLLWTSLWPARPELRVEITLADRGTGETLLTYRLLAPTEPADPAETERLRRRLSELLFGDLRESFGA